MNDKQLQHALSDRVTEAKLAFFDKYPDLTPAQLARAHSKITFLAEMAAEGLEVFPNGRSAATTNGAAPHRKKITDGRGRWPRKPKEIPAAIAPATTKPRYSKKDALDRAMLKRANGKAVPYEVQSDKYANLTMTQAVLQTLADSDGRSTYEVGIAIAENGYQFPTSLAHSYEGIGVALYKLKKAGWLKSESEHGATPGSPTGRKGRYMRWYLNSKMRVKVEKLTAEGNA